MSPPSSPLANVITLGVKDLARLRNFYRRLGWSQVADQDDFTAFELRGSVLALFPVDKLGADGGAEPEPGVHILRRRAPRRRGRARIVARQTS